MINPTRGTLGEEGRPQEEEEEEEEEAHCANVYIKKRVAKRDSVM